MKGNLASSIGIFLFFLFGGYALAGEVLCDEPKNSGIDILPLEFVSTTPTPPIPSDIPIGDSESFTYTLENNLSLTIQVTASITGSPSGDAVIDAASTCLTSTTVGSGTCTLIVDIEPTTLGAASFTLSANYTLGGEQSCFEPVTAAISYTATSGSYAYMADGSGNNVVICPQGVGGSLGSVCETESGLMAFNNPTGIAIPATLFSGNNYAYISNQGANTVSQCQIDTSTGSFISCGDSGASNIFSAPTGITFYTPASTLFAYVMDSGSGNITQCTPNVSTGVLGSCTSAFTFEFLNPRGIQAQTFGNSYVYIVNTGSDNLIRCAVTSTGLLVNCFDSGVGAVFDGSISVAFNESTNWYAYVTDEDTDLVSQCTVNSATGVLGSCADSGATGLNSPYGIAFETIDTTPYGYVTNFGDDTVSVCTIDPGPGGTDGNLTCTNSSTQYSTEAADIAYQTFGGVDYMYIADITNHKISQCKVYDPTGQLYCIDSGVGTSAFQAPFALTFNENPFNSTVYAYVTDRTENKVMLCEVNQTTGQFTGCVNAGPLGFYLPFGINFATEIINGKYYAYISDTGYRAVFQCELDTDGSITGIVGGLCNCEDAARNLMSPPAFNEPQGVEYYLFSGTSDAFLYIGNSTTGTVFQCAISNGVSGTGAFTSCADSGAGAAFAAPVKSMIEQVGANLYVYVSNFTASNVTQCLVNTTTGAWSACVDLSTIGASLAVDFDTVSGTLYAYVSTVPVGGVSLTQCTVDMTDGTFSDCVSPYGNPTSIAFETPSGPGYTVAYVTQNGGSGVAACQIDDADGTVVGCSDSGTAFTFTDPTDIVFYTVTNGTFAYVVNAGNGKIYQCTWNATTGILSACVASTPTFSEPFSITFDTAGGNTYLYVTDYSASTVSRCAINATTGVIGSCTTTGALLDTPESLAFENSFAYVADAGTDSIVLCDVDGSGLLTDCADSGATNISTPSTIVFQADTQGSPVTHAYIVNNDASNSITYCDIDGGTGVLSTCVDSGVADFFDLPYGLVFQSLEGTLYAYVTNSATGAGAITHSVSQCTLDTDGAFASCADSGAGQTPFTNPLGINFFPSVTN